MSDEGCLLFDVGFSLDVLILDVVLLGLATNPSQHSHLVGVEPCFIKPLCTIASTVKLLEPILCDHSS